MLSETKSSHLLNPFLVPLAMRDLSSCFGESSVMLPNSGGSGGGGSSTAASFALDRSLQGIHTCFYKSVLSTRKELLIKISWSKTHAAKSVSVSVEDITTAAPPPRPDATGTSSSSIQLLQKKKGSRSLVTKKSSVIGLHWDTSVAKYGLGPEPVKDFYLVVIADAEFALLLGDMSRDFIKKFEEAIPIAKFSLLSRKEQVSGATVYSTKSKFRDEGREHEILIQWKGDAWESRDSELSVSIDKKKAVQVRRLKWNFRGNQTIFIDGAAVDVMWDVHDWWFGHPLGCVLFMFKTRSALESRLWMDEELARTGQGSAGFFLMIEAFKRQ